MAPRTITRLYDSHDEAAQVVRELEAAGVSPDDISLVGSGHGGGTANAAEAGINGAGTGATLATLVGGGAGLLAGIGVHAIPGVGPVVAAGWRDESLTGAGVGAAAGGLLGSLAGAGVDGADAHAHAEGVRRGGTLVTVRTDGIQAGRIEDVLAARGGHVGLAARSAAWRAEGWERHDPAAPALGRAEVEAERRRRRVRVH